MTELLWTHADRLGSIVGLTGMDGVLKERLAYDAWGKRRSADGASDVDGIDGQIDKRGFTGHEMLDQLDLVHMNGRVYDPLYGRFLSADALVQDPTNGQSYNRYTYVFNNPTNATDPTGFASDPAKEPPEPKKISSLKADCGSSIFRMQCLALTSKINNFLAENPGALVASENADKSSSVEKINKSSDSSLANTKSASSRPDKCQSLGCINQSTGEATPITHHTGNFVQDMVMDEYSRTASAVWNAGRAVWNVIKEATILGIGGLAEGGAVAAGSGVWGSIKATQAAWEGTVIPRSFEMLAGGRQIWVHPNATEHMAEYAMGMLNRGVSAEAVALRSQAQLTSLQEAVRQATVHGMPARNVIINVGGWELQFSRNSLDKLPVLKHALQH